MKKINYMQLIGAAFLTLTLTACGSSGGSNSSSTTKPTTTLGITSVPAGTPSTKPSFASNIIKKSLNLFSSREAIAQAVTCPPTTFANSFKLTDGTIWVTQVYAIIDEIEFEDKKTSADDDPADKQKSVVDLTGTDSNVPDSIPLIVPSGNFNEMKFKIKRLEDDATEQPVNVTDLAAFLKKIGFSTTGNDDIRPSIFVEGLIGVGTAPTFTTCTPFKLVTDRRWTLQIPLNAGTFDVGLEEAVLLVDVAAAATASGVKASELAAEVGTASVKKPLGAGFLDGRFQNSGFGNPKAQAWAAKLAANLKVHTQPVGTFSSNSSRIDDSIDSIISGDDGDSSTDDNIVDTPESETTG